MNSSCQNKRNAKNEEQINLVTFLSQHHKNGRLNKGAIDAAMEYFPFKMSQIKVIWRLARGAAVGPNIRVDFTTKKKGNLVQKPKYSQESLITAIQSMTLSQRSTLRSLSNVASIHVSTLGKMRKKGWFLQHSNELKPFLMDVNKIASPNFAKSFVNPRTQKFDHMYNYIHIDEKWLYMTKINTNYYCILQLHPKPCNTIARLKTLMTWW